MVAAVSSAVLILALKCLHVVVLMLCVFFHFCGFSDTVHPRTAGGAVASSSLTEKRSLKFCFHDCASPAASSRSFGS
jgi:hypothetical protein